MHPKAKHLLKLGKCLNPTALLSKGLDPINGKGSFFSPNGVRFYLDKGGMYKAGFEGPHVDIWFEGHPSFEKVKYFLDGSAKFYTPIKQ